MPSTSATPEMRSACPICGSATAAPAFRRSTRSSTSGAADLRPTSATFGTTLGFVVRCGSCGHGSLVDAPSAADLASGYEHVDDIDDASEDAGRVATARRDLAVIATLVGDRRGRLVDIGCWTGALVAAATEMGWRGEGIEPSGNAVETARSCGREVRQAILGNDDGLEAAAFQVVTCCDVLEHLVDPAGAVEKIADLLEPGGLMFATVPDFGSFFARVLGRRWWSVLPMHVQYFTRSSLDHLLRSAGLEILDMKTHPKVFTRHYYAERFGEFLPVIGPWAARAVRKRSSAGRAVAPDFRDRLAVIARKPA